MRYGSPAGARAMRYSDVNIALKGLYHGCLVDFADIYIHKSP